MANCETRFAICVYKLEDRCLDKLCKTCGRLIVASHYMHCFHVCDQIVMDIYTERTRNNNWDDMETCDSKVFLNLED